MNLVEILAREMSEWPDDGTDVVGQSSNGTLHLNARFSPNRGFTNKSYTMADDWRFADVTRAEWETERARIKGKKAMPKANKDGWIRHRGGKCPVKDRSTYINGRFRSGEQYHGPAYGVAWSHVGTPSDLMAWRVHKPEQPIEPTVVANVEAFNAQAEIKADGPMQWRDRIREINGLLGDLRAEKANLIVKLEKEGFALIDEKPF